MPALTAAAWAKRKAGKVSTAKTNKAAEVEKVPVLATEKNPKNPEKSKLKKEAKKVTPVVIDDTDPWESPHAKPVSVQSREDLLASVTSEDAIDSAKRRVAADMSAYLACPADDDKGKKKILTTKSRVAYRPCSTQGNLLIHSAAVAGTAAEVATVLQWYTDNRVSSALANGSGCTPLQQAVVRGDVEVVKALLADPSTRKVVRTVDANNWGLLHYAARFCHGSVAMVEALVAKGVGVDVNGTTASVGGDTLFARVVTPLSVAKAHNTPEVVAALAAAGAREDLIFAPMVAPVDDKGVGERSDVACLHDDLAAYDVLVAEGRPEAVLKAFVELTTNGSTLLHRAISVVSGTTAADVSKVVGIWTRFNLGFNTPNDKGFTPLLLTVLHNNPAALRVLLEKASYDPAELALLSFDPKRRTANRDALEYAIEHTSGGVELIRVLIDEAGLDAGLLNSKKAPTVAVREASFVKGRKPAAKRPAEDIIPVNGLLELALHYNTADVVRALVVDHHVSISLGIHMLAKSDGSRSRSQAQKEDRSAKLQILIDAAKAEGILDQELNGCVDGNGHCSRVQEREEDYFYNEDEEVLQPLHRLITYGGAEGFAGSVLDLLIDNGARMDLGAITDDGRCALADIFIWSVPLSEIIVNRLVSADTKIPHPVPSWLVNSATALQKLREYKLTCENGHRCTVHPTCVPTESDRDCMSFY